MTHPYTAKHNSTKSKKETEEKKKQKSPWAYMMGVLSRSQTPHISREPCILSKEHYILSVRLF